jgi:hypothetical protein
MWVLPPAIETEYISIVPELPVDDALRTKGGLSPLTSTVKDPLLLIAAVFSCAGTEESFAETVPGVVAPRDAIPYTVDRD